MKALVGLLAATVFITECACTYAADTVYSMNVDFSGKNVYAPTLLKNQGTYQMWYSGWQTDADYPYDKIYFRSSADGINWSTSQAILNKSQVANSHHLGDPSVTYHYNAASNTYQYTMFFTVCMNNCAEPQGGTYNDNELWSAVSTDGVNWLYPKRLFKSTNSSGASQGAAEPSAILESGTDGTFWKVYYADRLDPLKIKMLHVNGNRDVIGQPATVFQFNGGGAISGPEVRFIDNRWMLFFNVSVGIPLKAHDVYKAESFTNTSWTGSAPLISNSLTSTICGESTPGVIPLSANQYELYFGQVLRSSDGSCDMTKHNSIQRWMWYHS